MDVLKMPRVLILILLVSFATLSAVLFTPGIPELAAEFGLSDANIQWVMSIYLLGYCFGQLPYGPLANRMGRKRALHVGLAIALLGAAIVYFSENFFILCLGRFIQAIGAAAGLKIAFTIIGDLHAGEQAAKAIARISISFAVVLGLGVAIGGVFVSAFGWRGCFIALLIYTVFLYFCSLILPETTKEINPKALQIKHIVHGYARQFKDPFLVLHATLMALCTTVNYMYSVEAPLVSIDVMKMTPVQYGMYNLIPAMGLAIGVQSARHLAGKVRPRIAMLSGILLGLIGTLLMLVLFANDLVNPWSFFLPLGIIWLSGIIPWIFASAAIVSEATDKSNASAVMQFINLFGTTVGTSLVGLLGSQGNIFTLPVALAIVFALQLGIWLFLRAHHRSL